ncbi:MAG: IS110 family transposase [Rhizobiales bacterium]|nr:IS110 family transposase [Hyphomicrobiales bacterium]
MKEIITIGLDIAKSVFQVHGVAEGGAVVVRKQLRRSQVLTFFEKLPPCLVGIEACGTAHHWSRELQGLGHEVRLMPAGYVKAYVKRNKNDAADAEAICEAVTRPTMRFVGTKSKEQQAVLMLHKSRQLFVRQRTMVSNAIRGHLAEFGITAPKGREGLRALLAIICDQDDELIPDVARLALSALAEQYQAVDIEAAKLERCLQIWHRSNETSRRLAEIPGVGPLVATALTASITDPGVFSSGRGMAAWIGLVPKETSTGGKHQLGPISKQGNRYLRWLLVTGAMAVIRYAKKTGFKKRPWLARLVEHRPIKLAAVALANKIARIAWVIMARGERYQEPAALAA